MTTLADSFRNGEDPDDAFNGLDIDRSPNEAFAEVLGLVAEMNVEMKNGVTADLIEKLRKWLARLRLALKSLAKALDAASYSISVGAPSGVSVAVTFTP